MYVAQPGLHIKFQDSQSGTEKHCLEKLKRFSQNIHPKESKTQRSPQKTSFNLASHCDRAVEQLTYLLATLLGGKQFKEQ